MRTSSAIHSLRLFFPPKTTSFPITRYAVIRRSTSLPAKVVCFQGKQAESGFEHFLDPPPEAKSTLQTPPLELDPDQKKLPGLVIDSMRPKALARVIESVPVEDLPPHVIYLVELGLELEKIQEIISRFPRFAYYILEGKVKPLVEFLVELGVPKSGIPNILYRRPQLCGISISKNLIPAMKYLEDELGIDKQKWSKLMLRFPAMFTHSRRKIDSTVSFLTEMGISKETVGECLTRYPNIVGSSVEDKLRPTVEYLSSLSVDVTVIVQGWPQILTLSIESNLRPKWEFFLSMGYSRSELVNFSTYFSYSLEGRIKPRYALMELCGVRLPLNQLLMLSDIRLDKALKAKMKKLEKSDKASEHLVQLYNVQSS